MKKYIALTLGLLAGTLASTPSAHAMDLDDDMYHTTVPELPETVINDEKSDNALQPYVTNETLNFYISGDVGLYYSDNIYHAARDQEGQLMEIFRPRFKLVSRRGSHLFKGEARFEQGHHFEDQENNYLDTDLRGTAKFALSGNATNTVNLRYRLDHQDIGATEDRADRQDGDPTIYHYHEVGNSFETESDLNTYRADVKTYGYRFKNVNRRNGTLNVKEDRNRQHYEAEGEIGRYVKPNVRPYVQMGVNTIDYARTIVGAPAGVDRDSKGYRGVLGVEFQVPEKRFTFNGNVGYTTQQYDANLLPDVHTLAASAIGQWQPKEEWLLSGLFNRQIRETVLDNTSAAIETRVEGEAEFDPVINPWSFGSALGIIWKDYQNNNLITERDDAYINGHLWAKYDLTDEYAVRVQYERHQRLSDRNIDQYSENVGFVRFEVAY